MTQKQWFQIISGAISGFITAGALFTTIFGQDVTLKIIAVLGLVNIVLSSIGTALSGPDSPGTQIKAVAALPGVERVSVNASATNGVAAAALDPAQPKIGPTSQEVRTALLNKAPS